MTKRIRALEPTLRRVQDTGAPLPRIVAAQVADALGGETSTTRLEGRPAPITLFVLRAELVKRLQSSGGRPALDGVARRPKIPLSDKAWLELEKLAAAIACPGFAPSAGQVASVLLTMAIRETAESFTLSAGPRSTLARQVAAVATKQRR